MFQYGVIIAVVAVLATVSGQCIAPLDCYELTCTFDAVTCKLLIRTSCDLSTIDHVSQCINGSLMVEKSSTTTLPNRWIAKGPINLQIDGLNPSRDPNLSNFQAADAEVDHYVTEMVPVVHL